MNKNDKMLKEVIDLINRMKSTRPLVECLTNRVTINDCANMLLAMGASPIMAEIECEMEEIMNISSALVINLGLLDGTYLSAMKTAAEAAKRLGKPIVLDPVGAGASKLRDETCREMIE
ncbi:MAG: hydroxyethylthiazole kinase, partial [Monoglobus pectinilyticus]